MYFSVGEVDVLTHKIEQLAEDLKSKDAEIRDWEGMLQREKEESLKQEQALINGYKSEMTALKKQVKIAEDLAFKKEKQLLELNDELDKVKVSKDMLQEDLTNFSDELENANNEKKNLAEQLENVEKEYGSYKSQNKEKLAEQLQNVEKEFEEYRSQNKENLAEQLKNVEKEFEDYRSLNKELEEKLQQKIMDMEDMTSKCDEHVEKINSLVEEVENLRSKNENQRRDIEDKTSQEREAVLKKQLKDASTNIEDLSQRICELEDKLLKSSQASESLRETLKETEKHQRASILPPNERETLQDRLSEYSQTIHDLEKEVQTKDKTIQQERAELQNLRHSIEEERRKYDTILTDAGANEAVLAHLREALAEQEDTMSKQDIVIQQKEAEISSIKHDLEVYMGNYKDLLSERSNASREIRELGIQNASLISDKERIQKQLNEKTVEHEQFTYDKERLQKQLEEKRRELDQTRVDGEISLSSLRQPLMAKVEELETEVKTLTKEKDNLSIVVKDNNKELKELEKCLSESRTECENLKLSQDRYKNEQLVDQNRLLEENVTDLKEKVKTRDQSLRDGKKQLAQLQAEMDACKETLLNKDNEMQTWKNEKDQLVASLEKIISSNKDSSDRIKTLENENISLKSQIQSQAETIQLLAGSIKEEPKTTTRRKTRNMSESSHSSSKSPVAAQENIPVLKPRTQRGRGRKRKSEIQDITVPETPLKTCQEIESDVSLLSDKNVDMSNHVQIDATPPVAARKVRRNKKKRDSIQHSREIKAEKETPQKGNQKDSMSSLRRIGSVITSAIKKSPLASSRSIRKPLEEVTEVTRSPVLEVADSGTQMSAEKATTSKKRRKQHALYNNDTLISDPIDCGAFVVSDEAGPETSSSRRRHFTL
ncbi:hypothetical protein FSP39_007235 [Pinctada imbricata]|uniref:Uncharacterized protein n=1 Tax=Pinctada imbricata TaxID=66713 RepID=A0AA88XSX4_PINIB|nr:hypothetical protein FSP39_007235 [Pinctada imbricata]